MDQLITKFSTLIGFSIREYRVKMELPQITLANAAGITVSGWSKIEAGKASITVGQLASVSDALKIRPHMLMNYVEGVAMELKEKGWKINSKKLPDGKTDMLVHGLMTAHAYGLKVAKAKNTDPFKLTTEKISSPVTPLIPLIDDNIAKKSPSEKDGSRMSKRSNAENVFDAALSGVNILQKSERNTPTASLNSYQAEVNILEKRLAQNPNNVSMETATALITNLAQLGRLQFKSDDYQEAISNYQRALDLIEELMAQNPSSKILPFPDTMRFNMLISTGFMHLYNVDLAAALSMYQRALAITLVESNTLDSPEYKQADVLDRIGAIQLQSGERSAALSSYQDSLSIREKLVVQDPDDSDLKRKLKDIHRLIAKGFVA